MSLNDVVNEILENLPAASRATTRRDGWANVLTGMGTTVDKTTSTMPIPFSALPDNILTNTFHADWLARKAVTLRASEALRLGVDVSVGEDAGGLEAATAVKDALDDLGAVDAVLRACTWENLYGGAVIVIGVDDGQVEVESQALPIRMASLRRVVWLRVVDRRYVHASTDSSDVDTNPLSPTYGQPTHYLIDTLKNGVQMRVHRSRVVVFPGALTTDDVRTQRNGWGISALDVIWEALQRSVTAWQSSGNAVANAQYVLYKLKGLSQMLMADGAEDKVRRRSRAMEIAKSMINAVLIDSEDEYIRENPNFGNLGDMLDRFIVEVSAALDIPVTKLWGRSPAGMNATGESDTEAWYASCDAFREHHLKQRFAQIIGLVLASREGPTRGKVPDKWSITWKPLRQMSQIEQADVRLKTAQADAAWVRAQVLLPEEVAMSRFRPEGFSVETQVDHDAREAILEAELERLKTEGRDTPPDANANANPSAEVK